MHAVTFMGVNFRTMQQSAFFILEFYHSCKQSQKQSANVKQYISNKNSINKLMKSFTSNLENIHAIAHIKVPFETVSDS